MVVPGDSVEFLPDFARFLLERSYYNLALSFLMALGNIPSIFTMAIFEGFSSGTYFSLRCTAISNDFAHHFHSKIFCCWLLA